LPSTARTESPHASIYQIGVFSFENFDLKSTRILPYNSTSSTEVCCDDRMTQSHIQSKEVTMARPYLPSFFGRGDDPFGSLFREVQKTFEDFTVPARSAPEDARYGAEWSGSSCSRGLYQHTRKITSKVELDQSSADDPATLMLPG
jgi:hypothetical protein